MGVGFAVPVEFFRTFSTSVVAAGPAATVTVTSWTAEISPCGVRHCKREYVRACETFGLGVYLTSAICQSIVERLPLTGGETIVAVSAGFV